MNNQTQRTVSSDALSVQLANLVKDKQSAEQEAQYLEQEIQILQSSRSHRK